MAIKNISITEEAYKRLAHLRAGNESFSEIIIKITGEKKRIMDFFGILSKEAGEALEKEIMKRRKEHATTRKKRIERISKELSS